MFHLSDDAMIPRIGVQAGGAGWGLQTPESDKAIIFFGQTLNFSDGSHLPK